MNCTSGKRTPLTAFTNVRDVVLGFSLALAIILSFARENSQSMVSFRLREPQSHHGHDQSFSRPCWSHRHNYPWPGATGISHHG